jgi:hypothetical protein
MAFRTRVSGPRKSSAGLPAERWSSPKQALGPVGGRRMPQKKHKPEEIVARLGQVDVLVSQG